MSRPSFPNSFHGVGSRLNKVGGGAISRSGLTIDGDAVDWDTISSIETRPLLDHFLSGAVSRQLDSLPLPTFPGRKKLVDALGRAAFSAVASTAREQAVGSASMVQIPASIAYKGALST